MSSKDRVKEDRSRSNWPDDWPIEGEDPQKDATLAQPSIPPHEALQAVSGSDIHVAKGAASLFGGGKKKNQQQKFLAILPGMLSLRKPTSKQSSSSDTNTRSNDASDEQQRLSIDGNDEDDDDADEEQDEDDEEADNSKAKKRQSVGSTPTKTSSSVIGRLERADSATPNLVLNLNLTASGKDDDHRRPDLLCFSGTRISTSSKFLLLTLHPKKKNKVVCKSIFDSVVVFGDAQVSNSSDRKAALKLKQKEKTKEAPSPETKKAAPVAQPFSIAAMAEKVSGNRKPAKDAQQATKKVQSRPARINVMNTGSKSKSNSKPKEENDHSMSGDEKDEDDSSKEAPEEDSDDDFEMEIGEQQPTVRPRSAPRRASRQKKIRYDVDDSEEEEEDKDDDDNDVMSVEDNREAEAPLESSSTQKNSRDTKKYSSDKSSNDPSDMSLPKASSPQPHKIQVIAGRTEDNAEVIDADTTKAIPFSEPRKTQKSHKSTTVPQRGCESLVDTSSCDSPIEVVESKRSPHRHRKPDESQTSHIGTVGPTTDEIAQDSKSTAVTKVDRATKTEINKGASEKSRVDGKSGSHSKKRKRTLQGSSVLENILSSQSTNTVVTCRDDTKGSPSSLKARRQSQMSASPTNGSPRNPPSRRASVPSSTPRHRRLKVPSSSNSTKSKSSVKSNVSSNLFEDDDDFAFLSSPSKRKKNSSRKN